VASAREAVLTDKHSGAGGGRRQASRKKVDASERQGPVRGANKRAQSYRETHKKEGGRLELVWEREKNYQPNWKVTGGNMLAPGD